MQSRLDQSGSPSGTTAFPLHTEVAPTRVEPLVLVGLVLLAAVILAWRYVGYQGHDDASYAAAVMDWARTSQPLGTNHWALRYTLILPAAAIVKLFGPSVFALAAVNLFAYLGFLLVMWAAVRHWFGWPAAAIVTGIGILLPQFPVQATYMNPDLVEMAFVVASFWCVMRARETGGRAGWLLGAGVLAGLGFLTRETSVLLAPLFGLMFLFRPAMPRLRYLLIAVGVLAVVGAQSGYFAWRAGDPLYRSRISTHHDLVDRSSKEIAAEEAGHALDSEGVLAVGTLMQPLSALFVSQKYGLLFYLAIPAYPLVRRDRLLSARQRSVLDWTAIGALVAFLFVAVNVTILYVVPRYFMVSAAFAAVPVAVCAARWLVSRGARRTVAGLGLAGFAASSLLLLYLENVDPMRPEEEIARFAATTRETLHVDPETYRRLEYLLLAGGVADRVTGDPPGAGALVATEDGVVAICTGDPGCFLRDRMRPFVPGPGWTEAARFDPPRRWILAPLEWLELDRRIPPDILRKVGQPGVAGIVYRVP